MMKWINRVPILLIWPMVVAYYVAGHHYYAFERYFDVGDLHVTDPSPEGRIELATSARALTDFTGSYKVIGRHLSTGHAACEGADSGKITYYAEKGYPDPPISMEWWEGPRGNCRYLPSGTYYVVTCWTVERPSLFSPVSGCVRINNFTVTKDEEWP